MQIQRIGFDEVEPDNNENYLNLLLATLESIDELCSVELLKSNSSLHVRIAPSIPQYSQPLLKELLAVNNLLGIKLELSKSIKKNSTLNFYINLHVK